MILLVGRGFTPGSAFFERLRRHACACAVARSLEETRAAVRAREFDLVLSEMGLPDGSAFPLLGLLEGTPATLFFCVGVHESCWWLPALERGRRTWGQAALRPLEFARALAALLCADALHSANVALEADSGNVLAMPSPEIPQPKPQRIETEIPQARKSSA